MEWLKKLGAAIDYIEDNLDKEISYDEAASIACCSPYYFQRVFSYVSGVSLSESMPRRMAADFISQPLLSLTEKKDSTNTGLLLQ